MTSNKKFPKCEELGARIEEYFNLHTEKPYWTAYFEDAERLEQALSQAENKGKYEERDRNIKWLWNQDNALCDEFKKEFPRKEKEEMGMNLLVKAEQSVLDKVEIRKQKERNVQLEKELGEQVGRLNVCEEKSIAYERQLNKAERILNCATHHFTHKLKTCCVEAEILQLEEKLKTAKQDGAKAEQERILKRLDDADCQCCGDTERIKVELMK